MANIYFAGSPAHLPSVSCTIDSTPPTFSGIQSVTPQNDGTFTVTWTTATSTKTPVRYEIFVALGAVTAAALFVTSNRVVVAPGALTSLRVGWLRDQTTYFINGQQYTFGIRAVDSQNYTDSNTVILNSTAIASGNIGGLFQATEVLLAADHVNFQTDHANFQTDHTNFQSDLTTFNTYLSTFASDLTTFASDLTTLTTNNTNFANSNTTFAGYLTTFASDLTTFASDLATMATQNTAFTNNNASFVTELAALNAAIAAIQAITAAATIVGAQQITISQPSYSMELTDPDTIP